MTAPAAGPSPAGGRGPRVSVVGASGYLGGELLRVLARHPGVELAAATSRRFAGRSVGRAHPNLRGLDLTFTSVEGPDDLGALADPDLVFLATPHGVAGRLLPALAETGVRVVDLSADHRLRDPALYARTYGGDHPHPEMLGKVVYGLPELHRDELAGADLASGTGCIATAAILALRPLADAGVVDPDRVVVDAKVGSSAAGAPGTGGGDGGADGGGDAGAGAGAASAASHHPERAGVVRPYALAGHRHEAEVLQETGVRAGLSVHAVEMVRGLSATVHAWTADGHGDLEVRDLWRIFRDAWGDEPFVRLVRERDGLYRYPEPKVVVGTNEAHVGFDVAAPAAGSAGGDGAVRLAAVCALDNLGKGGALNGVQAMNLMLGLDERAGLDLVGTHP